MTWLHRVLSMLPWVFRRSTVERRLDNELQMFVEMSTAEKIRDGASPAEARRQALIELGGLEQTKEHVRTGRHGGSFDEIGQNVRYGLRMVGKNPGFTSSSSRRWRSASAPTRPSSRSSTACCCVRCR